MSRENASVQLITSSGRVINSIDPVRIEDYLRSKRLPCSFRGKANSYLAKRDAPGQGWLLIKRSDLLLVDQTATTHKIRFTAGSTSVTVEKLHVYSVKGVTTSQAQQDDDIFLVEFRDMRQLAEFTSLDKAYNVRTPNWANTAEFFADTLNAAAQWTWATMVADIWTNISTLAGALTTALVDWPTSNPYNFNFYGTSALRTLEHICDSTDHHLLVKRNGSFHIVSRGNTDATNAALLTSQATRSLIPGDPQQHAGITLPAQVRVFFPKFNVAFQDNTDPLVVTGTEQFHVDPVFAETVTVIGTVAGVANVIANTIAPLHDSLEALYDEEGTLQNAAALTAQAEKRATEYIQGLLNSNTPREDLFHGAIGFEVGPLFAMVHWYDFGDGVRTQVFGTSSQRDEGTGDNAITEFPGLPDLSRHHLPFERFVVGEVYNTNILANESGTIRVQYGTHSSATVTTWADTALPHEIVAYELYGNLYAVGDRVVCGYHRQSSRWIIINSKGGSDIVHFELEATLALSGSAQAALLELNAGSYVDSGTNIEVCDWYGTEGMWTGITGYRGLAVARNDQVNGRDAYDIIWMEQIAQVIQFTSTERMGGTTANQMTATVGWYDNQGKEPVGTITLRDTHGMFADVHSGAKGTAIYDYHNGYYRIIQCQRIALFASATLTSDTCADTTPAISSFATYPTGEYVGDPGTTPSTVVNTCLHGGIAGDTVILRRIDNGNPNPTWQIVNVEKHAQTVVIDVQVSGMTLQKKEITIYVEYCTSTAPTWTTWHTGEECFE